MAYRLYFAYGSNMSPGQMRARCPSARPVGPARLDGFRFFINRRGTAAVRRWDGAAVHGVVFRVTHRCVETLDRFEGIRLGRYRQRQVDLDYHGERLHGFVYEGMSHVEGRPVRAYLDGVVIPAARLWGLPRDYIDELDSWFGAYRIGPSRPRRPGASWKA
ncbi:MAG: gamma-glutamylcyclotransferase family protein [Pseudomonadota bacterium]